MMSWIETIQANNNPDEDVGFKLQCHVPLCFLGQNITPTKEDAENCISFHC